MIFIIKHNIMEDEIQVMNDVVSTIGQLIVINEQ